MNNIIIESDKFPILLNILQKKGYATIGPTIQDNTILYDVLNSVTDMPVGYTDVQTGGSYKLINRNDKALFGYNVSPHSWKKFSFPPKKRLWQAKRNGNSFQVFTEEEKHEKYAFIGVRSCEISAIDIQDTVFIRCTYINDTYKHTRENNFIIAVNCGQAGGTCFCTSMETGPKATAGFDIALTEILNGHIHYFIAEIGTEQAKDIIADLPYKEAEKEDMETADRILKNTSQQMEKYLNTTNIKELFYRNYENPHWDEVAKRCLSCANCTMVCPTCFCSTVEDVTDLTGENTERWQKWDSCFTMDFSYIHGGSIRSSIKSRYRQWITHKLATWIDQFGVSGCVGCGRCITWCPVAIDITEEARAIRDSETNTYK